MSLTTIGGQPPPNAQPVPVDRLLGLAMAIEAAQHAAGLTAVSHALLKKVAHAQEAPVTHLYAAAAFAQLAFKHEYKQSVVICTGRCQAWGALGHLKWLLDERKKRLARGDAGFDIHARACLDQCSKPPVFRVHSSSGTAVVTRFGLSELRNAVKLF